MRSCYALAQAPSHASTTDAPPHRRRTTRKAVVTAIGNKLGFNRPGKSHLLVPYAGGEFAARVLAEYLELAAFVLLRRPLAAQHSRQRAVPQSYADNLRPFEQRPTRWNGTGSIRRG